jgi:type II secretory pathway component PulJ
MNAAIQQAMSNPMMQQMMSNPEIMRSLMQANPQMRQVYLLMPGHLNRSSRVAMECQLVFGNDLQ